MTACPFFGHQTNHKTMTGKGLHLRPMTQLYRDIMNQPYEQSNGWYRAAWVTPNTHENELKTFKLNPPFQGRTFYNKHFGTSVSSIEGNRILSHGPHSFLFPPPFTFVLSFGLEPMGTWPLVLIAREDQYQCWLKVRLPGKGNEIETERECVQ